MAAGLIADGEATRPATHLTIQIWLSTMSGTPLAQEGVGVNRGGDEVDEGGQTTATGLCSA